MTRSRDGWLFEGVRVDPARFQLLRGDEAVRIEPKALEVLIYLIERRERVVGKQELLDDLWKGVAVTENALTRSIAQIRKVLGDDLQTPRFIQTVPTRGYRFIAAIENEDGPDTAVVVAPVVQPAPGAASRPAPTSRPVVKRPRTLIYAVGLYVVLAVLLFAATRTLVLLAFDDHKKETARARGRGSSPPPLAARPVAPGPRLQAFPSFSPDGGKLAYSVDVDGIPHVFVSSVGGDGEAQITRGDGETQPVWSPDGMSIAYVSARGSGIWIVPASGGTPRRLTDSGARPAWSPDGNEIAYQSAGTIEYGWTAFEALPPSSIWIVNVRTGAKSALTKPGMPVGGHGAPSWRRDGTRIVFSSCDLEQCGIYTIARDSSSLTRFVDDGRRLVSPRYAPDGNTIYYVLGRYNNAILLSASIGPDHQRSGPIVRLRESPDGVMQHLAISADGRRFAWTLVEEASDLFTIDTDGSKPKQLTSSPTLRTGFPSFSPDGSKIAYCAIAAGQDGGVWIMDADGRNAKAVAVGEGLKQHTGWAGTWDVVYNAWEEGPALFKTSLITAERSQIGFLPRNASAAVLAPDGSTLAFNRTVDGLVSVWSAPVQGKPLRALTSGSEYARFPLWSPSGKRLAVQVRNDEGSSIGVLSVTGGLRKLDTPPGESHPYSFSPDEKEILYAASRGGVWNVYAMPIEGGAERRLTSNESLTRWIRSPDWSGKQIVYEAGTPKGNIWVSQ